MMAMTTSNSINVNAGANRRGETDGSGSFIGVDKLRADAPTVMWHEMATTSSNTKFQGNPKHQTSNSNRQ
jgi:hypothetical protein